MISLFCRLAADERGATKFEYGLVAFLLAVAMITTLSTLGGEVQRTVLDIQSAAAATR